MEETTISIIGIMLAAILMFIVPLVTIADRNDDISQLTVQTLTADFVDKIIRIGQIRSQDYNEYISRLESSGNTYDVEIEVKILDENPSKMQSDNDKTTVGANSYYSIYTSQIEEQLRKNNADIADPNKEDTSKVLLKEGDIVSVVAKNSSKTVSQALKGFYYTIKGEDLYIISSTCTATVAVNGST